jgi:23S rRNA (cytosine1962-C5)-methyltransferase
VQVILQRGKGRRVENGHPWVYGNEIDKIEGNPQTGDIVEVYNFRNEFIGKGYINQQSQITVRLLSRKKDEIIDKNFFRKKLLACRDYRTTLNYTENYRLVFGEGDFLPALVIDKLNSTYVIQTLSAGMDRWKSVITEILLEDFNADGVYERNDVPVRKLEGLEEQTGWLSAPAATQFVINERGVSFHVDIENGQKTGFFLDQKENRLAIQQIVKDKTVLDCFTYTGSFALFAAFFGAKHVTALDINQIDTICANAFDVLPVWAKEGKQFDVVILDPPAFTKNRKGIENAVKGYKEINLRGIKMVKPGGFLVTYSCSHFMDVNLFYDTIAAAASDANRTIREVQFLTQSKDHPIVWGVEETNYLKGLILQVL